ncbi:hypothetical protein SpCBS45565_g07404 [Spizellomyces sp. 'palustris']|nr:hypothetical protein SpCBS45565_g07404 [Spizellomyces sp. 'palustris']
MSSSSPSDPYAQGATDPHDYDPDERRASAVDDAFEEEDLETAEERIERENAPSAVDYYAVLNVERTATEEDIKNSYRRLCLTFHPDKHHRPEDKATAESRFEKIQKAHDVLSDPIKRHIYDTYGPDAAEMSWEVGARGQSREEIRAEFERQSRQRQEMAAETLVKPKGEISLSLDASPIFDTDVWRSRHRRRLPLGRFEPVNTQSRGLADVLQWPEVTQAFVKHSWETQITQQSTLIVNGDVMARNGIGVGNVTGTLRHIISPLMWGEVSGTIGQSPMMQGKLVKNFSSDSFATITATSQTISGPPTLIGVLGRRITTKTTGYLTYRTGEWQLGPWGADQDFRERSACSLGVMRQVERGQWNVDVQVGVAHSHISMSYFKVLPRSIRGRFSLTLSTLLGAQASIAGDKKITKYSRIGLGVDCASMGGVTFRLKLARLGQKFVLPIILSPQFDMRLAFWAAVLPVCVSVALDKFYFNPRRKHRLAQKLAQVRGANAEILAQRKQEAEDAVRIMKDSVLRKVEAEESRNGLIIVEALYGKLPPSDLAPIRALSMQGIKGIFENLGSVNEEAASANVVRLEYIDVTMAVQSLVNNSQLHVSGGHSKVNIIGFYDPCLGEQKRLRITYKFQGKLHQVEVDDQAAVAAPLRGDFPFLVYPKELLSHSTFSFSSPGS